MELCYLGNETILRYPIVNRQHVAENRSGRHRLFISGPYQTIVKARGQPEAQVKSMRHSSYLALCTAFAANCGAQAQEVLAPAAPYSVTAPVLRENQSRRAGFIPSLETSATGPQAPGPLHWGIFDLRPRFNYRLTYGSGLQTTPGEAKKTVINTITPGFLLDIGSHWSLDYTSTLQYYSDRAFRDSLGHSATLSGGTAWRDWVIGGSQSYRSSSSVLAETGRQTDQETFATGFNASYRFNSKLSTDLSLNQTFGSSENYTSYKQWSTMDWLNYQVWPRFTISVGLGGGYLKMNVGPDSIFEQYQGRIQWRATDKLSLQLNGGMEDRQFQANGASDLINPIFGASITYQPFEVTQLSLGADRNVSTSFFQNEVTENTSVHLSVNQRLLGHLYLTVGGGYRNTKHVASVMGFSVDRQDDNSYADARLSCTLRKHARVAIFYRHSENSSGQSLYTYTSEQGGFELGYHF